MRRPRFPDWVLVAALAAATSGCSRPEPVGEPLRLTVPRGATLASVTDTLAARGVIDASDRRWFSLYAKFRGDARSLRAGQYAFRRGEAWSTLLEGLTEGRVYTEAMTIPEGFTLDRMVPRIAEISEVPDSVVAARLADSTLYASFDLPGPTLEGYLFPDTYRLEPGTEVERVLEAMVRRYRDFWTPRRRARLDSLGMTERELVTLASIVQAEARHVDEMPLIASVYHNRLRRGQALQADPTVLYALGGWRERLLYAAIDSVADHPYNTYQIPGLPPGPIGSPGEAALNATLYPEASEFYYFVATPDGRHVFTRSLREHNRAKAEARRAWDRLERRGPSDSVASGGP